MSSKQQVLSQHARLLVRLLQNYVKAGTRVVLLSNIGIQLQQQLKVYKKGCARKLVNELTEKALARRMGHGVMLTESGTRFSTVTTMKFSLAKSVRASSHVLLLHEPRPPPQTPQQ